MGVMLRKLALLWSNGEYEMINKIIDNITTLFVFIMTCVVSFVLSVAQSNDVNLSGRDLLIFLIGFWGSVICITIRYVFLYLEAIKQNRVIKKIFMLLYLIVGSGMFILMLIVVFQLSDFSLKHDVLSYYNAYQVFMLLSLIFQWLGEKLFEK
ncbi:MAG: hypothetical protein K2O32_07895 [Acetatifactor sp.]|nr:hypothetical protein [Acetatifactor sp.]